MDLMVSPLNMIAQIPYLTNLQTTILLVCFSNMLRDLSQPSPRDELGPSEYSPHLLLPPLGFHFLFSKYYFVLHFLHSEFPPFLG